MLTWTIKQGSPTLPPTLFLLFFRGGSSRTLGMPQGFAKGGSHSQNLPIQPGLLMGLVWQVYPLLEVPQPHGTHWYQHLTLQNQDVSHKAGPKFTHNETRKDMNIEHYKNLQNTNISNVTQIPIKGSCTPASQADFVAVAMTSILRMRTASESSWGNASKRMLK